MQTTHGMVGGAMFLALFVFCSIPLPAVCAPPSKRWTELSLQESKARTEQVLNERRQSIAELIKILEDPSIFEQKPWFVINAVYTLGELRAEDATELLVKRIDAIQPLASHDTNLGQLDPCVRALIRIGKRASDACVEALSLEESPVRRKHLLRVVLEVETPEVAEAVLQKALRRESQPEKKRKLKAALGAL